MDLPVAEKFARAFEVQFPGIAVRVERSGSERVFQRIGQEMASGIHAVDVVNSADAAHVIAWHRQGWLAPYLPDEVARHDHPHDLVRALQDLVHAQVPDDLLDAVLGEIPVAAMELQRVVGDPEGQGGRPGMDIQGVLGDIDADVAGGERCGHGAGVLQEIGPRTRPS